MPSPSTKGPSTLTLKSCQKHPHTHLTFSLEEKMINTSGLSAPPSHLARCCNGKALLLAGYNHHMADTGPLGRRRSRVGCRGHSVSQQSPASLR